jgi:hypothetical protein
MKIYSVGHVKSNIQYEENIPKIIRNNIKINECMFRLSSKI